jgi:hypothetical protein
MGNDPSSMEPIGHRPWETSPNADRRCTAHKKNGEQCRNPARRGTNVCDYHGAKAPQVQRKARCRIEKAADRMARELLGIATRAESESVRLAAIRDALDRAGVTAKSAVELSATRQLAPWEQVMADIADVAQITREESEFLARRRAAQTDEPIAVPMQATEVVDAEVIPDEEDAGSGSSGDGDGLNQRAPVYLADESASFTARTVPRPNSISYEDAADIMRATRARTDPAGQRGRVRRVR